MSNLVGMFGRRLYLMFRWRKILSEYRVLGCFILIVYSRSRAAPCQTRLSEFWGLRKKKWELYLPHRWWRGFEEIICINRLYSTNFFYLPWIRWFHVQNYYYAVVAMSFRYTREQSRAGIESAPWSYFRSGYIPQTRRLAREYWGKGLSHC